MGYPGGSEGEESACKAGDAGEVDSIPGSGKSPGEGHGNPLQYSCWRIPWTEECDGLQSLGWQRVRHNFIYTHIHGQRVWVHIERVVNLPSK